jgi:hypothetical protein
MKAYEKNDSSALNTLGHSVKLVINSFNVIIHAFWDFAARYNIPEGIYN